MIFHLGERMHTVANVPGMEFHHITNTIAVITYPNRAPLLATNGPMGDLMLTDLPKPRLRRSMLGDEWLCASRLIVDTEWGWTPQDAYRGWVFGRLT